jgi:uncharacterized SAM-binding protein YcdF (DUF218 family)
VGSEVLFGIRLRELRRGRAATAELGNADPDLLETRAAITAFLFLRHAPAPVDFAFVLGSPTLSSVEPAIDLYLRGLTSKIMISGLGPNHGSEPASRSEAETYKDYAIERGIPEKNIITETRATNTLENFTFSHPVVAQHFGWKNIRSVAISGKPFHMRRALMTARAHWPRHLKLLMLPSDHPDDPPAETWWQTEHGRTFVLNELRSIGNYALAGDIGGF